MTKIKMKEKQKQKKPKRKTCYYAHAMSLYGTTQEQRDIVTLEVLGFEVVNPAKLKPPIGCNRMSWFVSQAIKCDVFAFRAFIDGKISSGVVDELHAMRMKEKPIIELPTLLSWRMLTLSETIKYLQELGER